MPAAPPPSPPVPVVSYEILGPPRVVVDGVVAHVGGRRPVAALTRLALNPGQVVTMDQLVEAIWAGDAPARPEITVRSYLSNLRRAIEPHRQPGDPRSCIERLSPGYRLAVEPEAIDAVRFERLVAEGRRCLNAGDADAAVGHLDAAEALWRGVPGEGMPDDDALAGFRLRLDELRWSATEIRFDARLRLGDHQDVIADLELAIASQPLRERLSELGMRALYAAGRQSDALAVYRRLRDRLVEELGVDPGPRIADLEHKILRHDPSLREELGPAVGPGSSDEPSGTDDPGPAGPDGAASGPDEPGGAEPADPLSSRPAWLPAPHHRPAGTIPPEADRAPVRAGTARAGGSAPGHLVTRDGAIELRPAAPGSVFVGRTRERAAAAAVGDALTAGLSASLVVTGEPGCGKTVVVDDTVRHLAALGVTTLAARAHPGRAEKPLWMWSPVLERLVGSRDRAAVAPPVATGLGDMASAVYGGLPAEPTVIVLEDLHWADPDSIDLVGLVADRAHNTPGGPPLGFVLSWRDTAPDIDLRREHLRRLARLPGVRSVELGPLSVDDVAALVAVTGGDAEAATDAHRGSAGNARLAVAVLNERASGPRGGPGRTVRELVLERVEPLADDAVPILAIAALDPHDVHPAVVAEVAAISSERVEPVLDLAARAGLLVPGGDAAYEFAHPVVAQTLAAELSPSQRSRAHSAYGQVLWRDHVRLHAVARHFVDVGSTGTSILAGRVALQALNGTVGPEHLLDDARAVDAALLAIEQVDQTDKLERELVTALAHLARLGGRTDRAAALGRRAVALAVAAGDPDDIVEAALSASGPVPLAAGPAGIGWLGGPVDPAAARWAVATAQRSLPADHPAQPLLAARLDHLEAGYALPWAGSVPAADLAAELARGPLGFGSSPTPAVVVDRLDRLPAGPGATHLAPLTRMRVMALLADGRHDEADRTVEVALAALEGRVDLARLELDAVAAELDLVRGRAADAAPRIERGLAVAAAARIDATLVFGRLAAGLARLRGDHRGAAARAEGWDPVDRRIWLAVLAAESGRPGVARRHLDDLVASAGWSQEVVRHRFAERPALVALAASRCGHRPAARAVLDPLLARGTDWVTGPGAVPLGGPTAVFACLAAEAVGEASLAARLLVEFRDRTRDCVDAATTLARGRAEPGAASNDVRQLLSRLGLASLDPARLRTRVANWL
ncbi:MAG: BTAD domain-containing putative transcriptional regulator [Acidimicrobiales bacterium]